MAIALYAHPFSSFCQKVLVALYENRIAFELQLLSAEHPGNLAELERLWPFKKFPVLVDDGVVIQESSIIIEYLAIHHPGPVRLIPGDAGAALDVRFMDRFFDTYI